MDVWDQGLLEPLLKYIKDPNDLGSIQQIFDCFANDIASQEAVEKKLLLNKDFRVLFESWYTGDNVTLAELSKLPEHTLGHEYAKYIEINKLDPNYIHDLESKNVISYQWHRARLVHDVTHVLTSFDTSLLGEAAVKGFEIAQSESPGSATLLGGGIIAVVSRAPKMVGPLFEAISRGYQLGKSWPFMHGIKWDKEWRTPITELKSRFGLTPAIL